MVMEGAREKHSAGSFPSALRVCTFRCVRLSYSSLFCHPPHPSHPPRILHPSSPLLGKRSTSFPHPHPLITYHIVHCSSHGRIRLCSPRLRPRTRRRNLLSCRRAHRGRREG